MPTGRPDYWYGTALYFEENPADGEVTRGPTSNWAYDHKADVDGHHPDPRAAVDVGLGENVVAAGDRRFELWSAGGGTYDAAIIRKSGENGELQFVQSGTAAIAFRPGEAEEIELPDAGGITGIWDDTPTNGEQAKGVTSDWAFDHVADVDAHHAKYTDAEAVTAMGAKADSNALNHDRYSPRDYDSMRFGYNLDVAGNRILYFCAEGTTTTNAAVTRYSGANGSFSFVNYGTAGISFYCNGATRLNIHPSGGLQYCWDDTPTNGQTLKGVTSDWAYDHVNDVDAHGPRFVDRGDPAAEDFDEGDLTLDGSWYDLDLSALCPAGASAVLLQVAIQDDAAGTGLQFRQNGNSNAFNIGEIASQVANVGIAQHITVKLDANRVIEYLGSVGLDTVFLTVCGYWI